MHFHCEIWVKNDPTDNLEEIVARLMGKHEEDGGYWDWFVVGGRWTGVHDGYEPSDDIRNYSICKFCGGTGTRNDWKSSCIWARMSPDARESCFLKVLLSGKRRRPSSSGLGV
jgi:hypothetical protein